jgi:IrrE N-terminal-like domain
MTTNASQAHRKNERLRAHRSRLSAPQIAIEQQAMRFRAQLGISDFVYLPLELAVSSIPNCEVFGLRHVPGITLHQLSYARTVGYRSFGALARRDGETIQIVFNDAHQADSIRVNVMEEVFHIRLGHRPDILSILPVEGRHRTYDASAENEAYGCAIASLVPFSGLQGMLARHTHIARIAEHFSVTIGVIEERIGATDLGYLMNAQFRQMALVPSDY